MLLSENHYQTTALILFLSQFFYHIESWAWEENTLNSLTINHLSFDEMKNKNFSMVLLDMRSLGVSILLSLALYAPMRHRDPLKPHIVTGDILESDINSQFQDLLSPDLLLNITIYLYWPNKTFAIYPTTFSNINIYILNNINIFSFCLL